MNIKGGFKFSFLYFFLLHVPTFLTMRRREIDTLIDYSCGLRMKVWLVQSGITFESGYILSCSKLFSGQSLVA